MKLPWQRSTIVPLSATVTATGGLTIEATSPQVQKHLVERILAELDEGDIDGAKQAATRLLTFYAENL